MKTATIDQYHVFGTSSGHGVRLIYRGRVLLSLVGHASESAKMLGAAIKRATAEGFTHWKRADGAGGIRPIVPDGWRIGYLKKDRQEQFTLKRAWFVNAWRIVDAEGRDMVQPWASTKSEAREMARQCRIALDEGAA